MAEVALEPPVLPGEEQRGCSIVALGRFKLRSNLIGDDPARTFDCNFSSGLEPAPAGC